MNYMPGSELEEIMDCNTISLKQSIWWQVKYSEENSNNNSQQYGFFVWMNLAHISI